MVTPFNSSKLYVLEVSSEPSGVRLKFDGNFDVDATAAEVYDFITDARKMASVIPDVLDFEMEDADNYRLTVKVGLSFIKGKFRLKVKTTGKIPARHAEIAGNGTGSGSSATFRGICDIRPLTEDSSQIDWAAEVEIGGLAAAVGSRLVQSASEKYLNQLIESFKKSLLAQKKSVL